MPSNNRRVENIVCFRNDRFGEFLLNIPAFRAIKKSYPGSRLTLVTDTYVRELGERIGLADEVICWESRKHGALEIFRLALELKKRDFQLSVAFNPSREFNIAAFLAGIPVRVGYDRKLGLLLTRRAADKKYLGERHEVEYNLELAGLAGASIGEKGILLTAESSLSENLLKECGLKEASVFVAIHPWTSDPVKQWPTLKFNELAERLSNETGVKVIIVGGREEYPKSLEFCRGLKACNLTGKTSLLELASLLKRCRLLITGDSGPMHLSASVGTPVIALFRNDLPGKSPKRWGPWGEGHAVIEKKNLEEITVDEVYSKAKERLTSL